MKDVGYLLILREEVNELIRLRRIWNRRAALPGSSPKIVRLRTAIEIQIKTVQRMTGEL